MADGVRRVRSDETGAILVIGVFAAVFLVGVLFYVVAIGEAVLRRERLGDAADAVSMTAAVVHARSMNLVALLNQVMAALLAVLVALRLVEMLATLAIILLLAAAFLGGAAGLLAIPGLESVRSGARSAYTSLDAPVHECLGALHRAASVVSAAAPALAELEAASIVRELDASGGATSAFVVPPRLTLPVEDDAFDALCSRAGTDAATVAMLPLSPLLPGVSGDIEDALGDLAGSASDWFCGRGGAKSPTIERTVTRVLPTLDARERCEASTLGAGADAPSSGQAAGRRDACAEVASAEAASEPDSTGACRVECGDGGAYEERVRKARAQCNPGRRPGLRGFTWQERIAHIELIDRGVGWRATGRRWNEPARLVSNAEVSVVHPCGTSSALYSPDFETAVHPAQADPAVLPVCSSKIVLPARSGRGVVVTVVTVTEVLQILRCVVSEKRTIGGDPGHAQRAGDADDEAPARVVAGAALGGETFQMRGVVLADQPATYVDGIVGAAAWGAKVEDPAADMAALGRLSVAQAEYYFDHDGGTPRGEWLWSRRWTARLRRFRVPAAVPGANPDLGAGWLGAAASLVPATVLRELGDLSSH